jgi:hypothetical protein
MRKALLHVLAVTVFFAMASPSSAAGQAAPPPARPAPAAKGPAKPLEWFQKGYGMFAAAIGMHTWGEMEADEFDETGDIDARGVGGFHLSGYYVHSQSFHIGGFFYFFKGEHDLEGCVSGFCGELEADVEDLGVGVTVKLGTRVHNRIWIGGALDFGMAYLAWDEGDEEGDGLGLVIFPRFVFDLMAFQPKGVKVVLHASLGVLIVPYLAGEANIISTDSDFNLWAVRLVMLLGVTVGK